MYNHMYKQLKLLTKKWQKLQAFCHEGFSTGTNNAQFLADLSRGNVTNSEFETQQYVYPLVICYILLWTITVLQLGKSKNFLMAIFNSYSHVKSPDGISNMPSQLSHEPAQDWEHCRLNQPTLYVFSSTGSLRTERGIRGRDCYLSQSTKDLPIGHCDFTLACQSIELVDYCRRTWAVFRFYVSWMD